MRSIEFYGASIWDAVRTRDGQPIKRICGYPDLWNSAPVKDTKYI